MRTKTYRNIVFSGKDTPYEGISDGKGPIFRGKNVELSINLVYHTDMSRRGGSNEVDSFGGRINNVAEFSERTICEGSNIWSD